MEGSEPPSKIDLRYAEQRVVFTISDCCTGKRYSFYSMGRLEAEIFTKRLRHFEQLTWRQLGALPRERGLTPETVGNESWQMIHEQNTSMEKMAEQYYFHLRIEHNGKFRIFGYQKRNLFCITHIDVNGEIHNH